MAALGALVGRESSANGAPPAGKSATAGRQAAPAEDTDDEDRPIVVNGKVQLPGAVVGDIPAELQYSPADIRAYGVSTVADLLSELAPEIQSDRGRGGEAPVVLLNGRRISSFSEIRDIPTEAILRVDILPEEVALKYGYSADQRVVNIVLRRRFRALTAEGTGGTTTEGGGANGVGSIDLLKIHGDSRLNLDLKYQQTESLRESDRGIMSQAITGRPYALAGNVAVPASAGAPATIVGVPASAANGTASAADFAAAAPNVTDISPYRTLTPDTHEVTLNTVLAHPLSKKASLTLNGTFDATTSDSLRGLAGTDLLVPADDPFSPFGSDVALYRYLDTKPLRQSVFTLTGHLGFTLDADVAKWRLSFTGNYDHSDVETHSQTGIDTTALQTALDAGDASLDPFGAIPSSRLGGTLTTKASAVSDTGNVQFVGNGPLFDLPAGPLATTVKAGFSDLGFSSTSTRAGREQHVSLTRRDASGQLNVDVPLTSRKNHILGAIGDLSANFNVAVDQLSDFGTLPTYGYGLNWTPRDGINLIASETHDHAAPTVQQLGNPVVVTPGARVFDYRTGQTVDVTETAGGNPGLKADSRRVEKLGLTVKPVKALDLTFTANYIHSTIRNAIAALPSPTAAIEAAFPDRFARDADGELEAIDVRPVNFARETRQELRWGMNLTLKLKSSRRLLQELRDLRRSGELQRSSIFGSAGGGGQGGSPAGGWRGGNGGGQGSTGNAGTSASSDGTAATTREDGGTTVTPGQQSGGGGGGRGGGRGGFGGGRGGAAQGGRLQISFYHTWYFRDDILINQGGPKLDLLDGGTTGSGGGQPRHEVQLQVGLTNNGIGARFTGQWQSPTTVTGGVDSPTGDLHFSSLVTANFRLFADLGQQPRLVRHAWARGMRLTLSVNNIFDSRQHVRDAQGDTPLSYQPGYLDPLGRSVKISLRKLFY